MNGMNFGICTLCGKESSCVCQRCRDFYCSPTCQKNDWPRHRYICFPMPALVSYALCNENNGTDAMPLMTAVNMINGTKKQQSLTLQRQKTNEIRDNMDDAASGGSVKSAIDKESSMDAKGMQTSEKWSVMPKAKMPRANSRVRITGFHSVNRCYVRPLNDQDNLGYSQVLATVNKYGKTALPVTIKPKLKSYVLVDKCSSWYRGQVIGCQTTYKLLLVDLGIMAIRKMQELRQITNELIELPVYPFLVQLSKVPNYRKSDDLVMKFYTYETREYRIEYEENDKIGITTKLYDWSTDKLLNDEIFELAQSNMLYDDSNNNKGMMKAGQNSKKSFATDSSMLSSTNNTKKEMPCDTDNTSDEGELEDTGVKYTTTASIHNAPSIKQQQQVPPLKKPQQESGNEGAGTGGDFMKKIGNGKLHSGPPKQSLQTPVFKPPFDLRYLELSSKNISVRVTDASCLEYGYIGVMPSIATDNFNQIHAYLKKFATSNLPPYKPKVLEYCLAKFDGDWFRAKVIEVIDDNEYNVVYIDFTNEANITSDEIRRYPRDLTNNCYTNLCLIHGLPENLTPEQSKNLKAFLDQKTELIVDRVLDIDDNIVHLECSMIINQLQ